MKPLPSSARLHYEALGPQHAAELFSLLGDPALYTFQPGEPPVTLDGLYQRYQRLSSTYSADHSERWLNWVMRSSTTGKAVGTLQATVRQDRSAYVAYFVFTDYQQQGYASEGLLWMLELLRSEFGCTTATADVDTRNDASNRLLRKAGFEQIGMTRDADFFRGATSDEFHYRRWLGE